MIKQIATRVIADWRKQPFALRIALFLAYEIIVCAVIFAGGATASAMYLRKGLLPWSLILSCAFLCASFIAVISVGFSIAEQQKKQIKHQRIYILHLEKLMDFFCHKDDAI